MHSALSVLSVAFFAVTVYTVRALTSVGVPLMVQVALSILKPAGSVGATVQLTIAPPELLKVMSVMALLLTIQVVRLPVVQRLLHYQLA
jgi:hypothetical protein